MKKIALHIASRLLIVALPLTALYFFAQMAFEENRRKEHPTDAGLGIAILLALLLIVLFIGFLSDALYRMYKKDYAIALTNLPFLLLFSIPILYISCKMGTYCEDCFCDWFVKLFA